MQVAGLRAPLSLLRLSRSEGSRARRNQARCRVEGWSLFRTALAAGRAVGMLMDTSLVLYQYMYCSPDETSLPTTN